MSRSTSIPFFLISKLGEWSNIQRNMLQAQALSRFGERPSKSFLRFAGTDGTGRGGLVVELVEAHTAVIHVYGWMSGRLLLADAMGSKIFIFQNSRFLKTRSYSCRSTPDVVEGGNKRLRSALILYASNCMLVTL